MNGFIYKRGEAGEYSVQVTVNDGAMAYSNIQTPLGTPAEVKVKLLEEAEIAVLKQLEMADEIKSSAV